MAPRTHPDSAVAAPTTAAPAPDSVAAVPVRVVKGRYRMPHADYALLKVLKSRAASTGARPRKSDLLRAGLHALMESGRLELRRALDRLEPSPHRRAARKPVGRAD